MSEQLQPNHTQADQFQALHIHLRTDYETYFKEVFLKWEEHAKEELEAGRPVRPLWLRRTDEMGSEFGAIIDYIIPIKDEVLYLATIDIDGSGGQTDISVLMPSEDGSGEPVRVTNEAYTLPALQRAIAYVESRIQPNE